jgi:hypothetical protein
MPSYLKKLSHNTSLSYIGCLILGIFVAARFIRSFSFGRCEHLKGAWQPHTLHEIASADFASLAMTKGKPSKPGNYIFKQPNYKLPLKGLEPLHLAPEASALSSELQGLLNFK